MCVAELRDPLSSCFLLSAALAGCACGPQGETPGQASGSGEVSLATELRSDTEMMALAEQRIDASSLRAVIGEIASDEYAGRAPSSDGDVETRRYLRQRLEQYGYLPGGPDNSWEQPIDLVGMTSEMPDSWLFRGRHGSRSFRWWDEFIAGTGTQRERVSIGQSEVVFVGYGITAPEESWDDIKGADLRDKILLMLNNDPDWDPGLFGGRRRLYYGRWTYKYEAAAAQGAAGAIIVHTDESAGYPWHVVQTSWTGEQFELPAADEPRLGVAGWLTLSSARDLAALGGHDLDALIVSARSRAFRPVPLGVSTSLSFSTRIRTRSSANVLGLLEGSDPVLADQVVVFTAHHDHLGTGEPDETGDSIYNGAVDNASGVAQVLAISSAFAALDPHPRRSILIAFVAAEEQGLLGSHYFSRHPTVPPARIAAAINIDGGNIWGRTADVAVIGRGKSSLEDILAAAAGRQGRRLIDEPFPDKGFYYRSDQLNFARIGVPALYFKSGTDFIGRPSGWGVERIEEWIASKYHRPGDELDDSWNFDGMVDDARLAFRVGLDAANDDVMPAWRAGDEFEAVRRDSLARLDQR